MKVSRSAIIHAIRLIAIAPMFVGLDAAAAPEYLRLEGETYGNSALDPTTYVYFDFVIDSDRDIPGHPDIPCDPASDCVGPPFKAIDFFFVEYLAGSLGTPGVGVGVTEFVLEGSRSTLWTGGFGPQPLRFTGIAFAETCWSQFLTYRSNICLDELVPGHTLNPSETGVPNALFMAVTYRAADPPSPIVPLPPGALLIGTGVAFIAAWSARLRNRLGERSFKHPSRHAPPVAQ